MVVEVSKAGYEVPSSQQPFMNGVDDSVSSESEPELNETHSSQDYYKNDQVQPTVEENRFPNNVTVSLCSSQLPVDGNEPGLSNGSVADDHSKSANLMVSNHTFCRRFNMYLAEWNYIYYIYRDLIS